MRSDAEVMRLLEAGNVHRAVAAHNLNDASSRSHAICTLQVPAARASLACWVDAFAPRCMCLQRQV